MRETFNKIFFYDLICERFLSINLSGTQDYKDLSTDKIYILGSRIDNNLVSLAII